MLSTLLVGCNNSEINEFNKVNSNIESEVKIKSKDNEYKCKVYHTPEGLNTITFISPKNLEGFTISRNCGKYEVIQKELQGEYLKDPLPEDSELRKLMDILDNMSREEPGYNLKSEEEGERTYSGEESEIVVDKRGNIIRIILKNPEAEMEFQR